ncbi:MAG: hypothetical protein ACR2FE_02735 [Aeromicrobium sp.]
MDVALTVVTLVAIAIAVNVFSQRLTIATPLVLIVVGFGAS